jgi:hypothetical protein
MFRVHATKQIEAAGTRPLRWYFSQKEVADYAKGIFKDADLRIETIFQPWPGSKK